LHTNIDFQAFANQWISDWNRRDFEAVLVHFGEGVTFTSPRVAAIMGTARIDGKVKLREYWMKALSQIQTIQFTLDYVTSNRDRVGIVYTSEINGRRMRSVEFLVFGEDGLIREGEAMHGIQL
jgi:hypothetical protein